MQLVPSSLLYRPLVLHNWLTYDAAGAKLVAVAPALAGAHVAVVTLRLLDEVLARAARAVKLVTYRAHVLLWKP